MADTPGKFESWITDRLIYNNGSAYSGAFGGFESWLNDRQLLDYAWAAESEAQTVELGAATLSTTANTVTVSAPAGAVAVTLGVATIASAAYDPTVSPGIAPSVVTLGVAALALSPYEPAVELGNAPPVVTLTSPEDESATLDTTPAFEFIGTDADDDELEYQIQIDTVNTFDSGVAVCDSYAESNYGDYASIITSSYGQSFTGNGYDLSSCKFYIRKNASPTGNICAKLYAHSGTYGTSSIRTGVALATSSDIDVSTIGTSFSLVEFTFLTPYTLSDGEYFVIMVEPSSGYTADVTNRVAVGYDNSSPTHGGNLCVNNTYNNNFDVIFYVNTTGALIDAISTTDPGFENLDDSGDEHPFTQNEEIRYTVQEADELGSDVYYWRVRAYDGTVWGDWSETRSLTVNGPQTIALGSASLSASGNSVTVVPGAVSSTQANGAISATAYDLAVDAPYPAQTVTLSNASLTAAAYDPVVVPGAVSVELSNAQLSATAYDVTTVPGAVTVALGNASQTITPYDLEVTTAAAVALENGSISASVYDVATIPGAVTSVLSSAQLSASAYNPAIIPGAIANILSNAELSASAYGIQSAIEATTIELNAASITVSAYDPAVILGAVTISLSAAQLSASAFDAAVIPGAITTSQSAASLTISAYDQTTAVGATSISMACAQLSANAQPATVVPGAVTVAVSNAQLSVSAYNVTVGATTTIAMGVAVMTTSGHTVTIVTGETAIALEAAGLSVQAYTVATSAIISTIMLHLYNRSKALTLDSRTDDLTLENRGGFTLDARTDNITLFDRSDTLTVEDR